MASELVVESLLKTVQDCSIEGLHVIIVEELGEEIADILKAAQVDGDDFINLTEDELKGLFPVFKQAKKIRTFMNKLRDIPEVIPIMQGTPQRPQELSLTPTSSIVSVGGNTTPSSSLGDATAGPSSSQAAKDLPPAEDIAAVAVGSTSEKSITTKYLNFTIYKDAELSMWANEDRMPGEVIDKLVKCTMYTIRGQLFDRCNNREPSEEELDFVATALLSAYPSAKCQDPVQPPNFLLLKKLKRRRQNTAPVKSPQGKTPQRSRYQRDSTGKYERDDKGKLVRKSSSSGKGPANKKKKKSVENTEENATEDAGADAARQLFDENPSDNEEEGTEPLPPLPNLPEDTENGDPDADFDLNSTEDEEEKTYTPVEMARAYKTMKKLLAMEKVSWTKVDKLMDIEKKARWDYLMSLDRPKTIKQIQAYVSQILKAYPNFNNASQLLNKAQRCLAFESHSEFLKCKVNALLTVIKTVYQYGLLMKAIESKDNKTETMFTSVFLNLNNIFKQSGKPKHRLLYYMGEKEDIQAYCRKSCYPELVVAYDTPDIVLTLGGEILATLHKPEDNDPLLAQKWAAIWLYYFAMFYSFHLQYPTGYEIGLMIIQKESMDDDFDAGPLAKVFEKEYAKFKSKA